MWDYHNRSAVRRILIRYLWLSTHSRLHFYFFLLSFFPEMVIQFEFNLLSEDQYVIAVIEY